LKIWRFVVIRSLLCHLLPQDRLPSFWQLAVFRRSIGWLTFHSLERQSSITMNGIDLFHVLALHSHYITELLLPKKLAVSPMKQALENACFLGTTPSNAEL